MNLSTKHSVMSEITKIEDAISTCYERVYQLKSKLNNKNITEKRKNVLEKELIEVEKLLVTNKTLLKSMHQTNRTSFFVAAALCLLIFMAWMLFHLLFRD